MKKLVLETTAPFQGLPELVAYDEGLFEKEGLLVEWADREQGVEKKVDPGVTSPKGVNPFASHGKLFEQGKADMYNACEWGNYCRVQDTGAGSRQIGSRYRLDALLRGEVDATTLTEPHITLAEKKGCRTICSAFFHGTEVASARVDAETYGAFNRAVREAVRRINANQRAYLHYFIDYYARKDPEIAALKVEDLRERRLVVCDPAPIPADEMQRTYDWLKSWGMLEETASPLDLVNVEVQHYAHQAAE